MGLIRIGMTAGEVATILGHASRDISSGEVVISSYRDEQIGDALYGIRVAFKDGLVAQCYLGFELLQSDLATQTSSTRRRLQLLLVVIIGVAVVLLVGRMCGGIGLFR